MNSVSILKHFLKNIGIKKPVNSQHICPATAVFSKYLHLSAETFLKIRDMQVFTEQSPDEKQHYELQSHITHEVCLKQD